MKNLDDVRLDPKIKKLVESLLKHGLNPLWSCQGTTGHLCARPTIIVMPDEETDVERRIKNALKDAAVSVPYWISRVHGFGTPKRCPQLPLVAVKADIQRTVKCGSLWVFDSGTISNPWDAEFWMIELKTRNDYLPFPIASRLTKLPRWAITSKKGKTR